jgi:hypothetical protein
MTDLGRLVQRYVAQPAFAGRSESPTELDRRGLQRDLSQYRSGREAAFWICVALLLILFIGACLAVFAFRDDPAKLTKLSAATGVTLMGTVAGMTKLWQQRVRADLVIALTKNMSEDALKSAMSALIKDL